MMDGWKDHLHFAFLGEHVLFPGLRLDTLASFLAASFVAISLAFSERAITYALQTHWSPLRSVRSSRWRTALWRSALYWIATLERLTYMLLTMTFHVPLILVTVTALATGQFVIELLDTPPSPSASSNHDFSAQEYLMGPPSSPPSSVMLHAVTTRPRAKSRAKPPSAIFIHPAQSNLARADAAALELGLGGDTERVRAPGAGRGAPAWAHGHGPQAARALLGNARRNASEKDPERRPLYAHDSDSDERD